VINFIDFLDATCPSSLIYRLKHGGGHKKQAIARAVGTSDKNRLQVIDATCGFGTDAIVLAYLNCHVWAIEKNPTVAQLARDRLLKINNNSFLAPIIKNITLFNGDALQLIPLIIQKNNCLPDVIYLDPMFNKKTSAAPNKLMQILQSIIASDNNHKHGENQDNLLKFSLQHSAKRVVVKRPRVAPYLEDIKPDFSLTGKANRFDVYLTKLKSYNY
jgi:16S rRNA (guanine1516-N2)-methyltransferase